MNDLSEKYKKYVEWQKVEYSADKKLRFLAFQELFHLIIMPSLLVLISKGFDFVLKIASLLQSSLYSYIGGAILIVLGLSLSLWTRWTQFKIGQGTPAPIMPTQKLVIKGPYVFCRNPMILGDVIWLIGLSILVNSISSIIVSLIWFIGHLIYYKTIEEKELTARFGEEYINYKKRVPFIIPFLKIK